MLRRKEWKIFFTAVLLIVILGAVLFIVGGHQTQAPCRRFVYYEKSGLGYPNPAAVYCKALGYEYRNGICEFPDGTKCDAWDFLNGKCGQKWSYCERTGGRLVVDGSCSVSQTCGVCVLPSGKKCFEWEHCLGKC